MRKIINTIQVSKYTGDSDKLMDTLLEYYSCFEGVLGRHESTTISCLPSMELVYSGGSFQQSKKFLNCRIDEIKSMMDKNQTAIITASSKVVTNNKGLVYTNEKSVTANVN